MFAAAPSRRCIAYSGFVTGPPSSRPARICRHARNPKGLQTGLIRRGLIRYRANIGEETMTGLRASGPTS